MRLTAIVGAIGAAVAAACDNPVNPASSVVWYVPGQAGAGRPALDASTVYFIATADSHAVHAFDLNTGKPRWSGSTGVTGAGTFSRGGCMLAAQLVACGDGAGIAALATSDGHLVWSFQPAGQFPGIYISTLDSARTTIFAPAPKNAVYSIDAATGHLNWSAPVIPGATSAVVSKVVDGGDVVYATFSIQAFRDTGGVVALSKVDGSTRWLAEFTRPDSAAGADDIALWENYILVSLENGRIEAVDRTSTQIAWELPGVGFYPSWEVVAPVGIDYRTLVVTGNTLTAISQSGWVVTYDLTTHTQTGRGTASMGAGALFGSSNDATTAYFVSTGELLFSFTIGMPTSVSQASGFMTFLTAPALTADKLFVGGVDGYYALRR